MKAYKEYDIIIGSELKHNNSIEFKYAEPEKLKEVERFFIEFFVLNYSTAYTKMFLDPKQRVIKYIDSELINLVNEYLIAVKSRKNISFDVFLSKIKEVISLRKENYDKYIKANEHQYDDNRIDNDVSCIFTITSEVKPNLIPNGSVVIDPAEILKNTINESINITNIGDDEFSVSKSQEYTLFSNNISLINNNNDNKAFDVDKSFNLFQLPDEVNYNTNTKETKTISDKKIIEVTPKVISKQITKKNTLLSEEKDRSKDNIIKNNILASKKQNTITQPKEDKQPNNIDEY